MTEKDQNDPMAAERARTAFAELEGDAENRMRGLAAAYADTHVITWERAVNTAGVPVRRYVARSAWEVDPAPGPCPKDESTGRCRHTAIGMSACPVDDRELLP